MLPDPLHPAVVHMPIALAFVLPLLFIVAASAIRRGAPARAMWLGPALVALLLFFSAFVAVRSGLFDHETVEGVIASDLIHEHEEAGERLALLAAVTAVFSLLGLLRGRFGGGARGLATLASVGVAAMALLAGRTGGELVYEHDAASAHIERKAEGGAAPGLLEILMTGEEDHEDGHEGEHDQDEEAGDHEDGQEDDHDQAEEAGDHEDGHEDEHDQAEEAGDHEDDHGG